MSEAPSIPKLVSGISTLCHVLATGAGIWMPELAHVPPRAGVMPIFCPPVVPP